MAESSHGADSSSLPSTSKGGEFSSLLRQKEHDIEIAAQIGQSLLERNRELQIRNEFLEESLATSSEQTTQLRYELHRRVELLRYFSIDDDEFGAEGESTSLGAQIERLRRENKRLTAESNGLKKDLEGTGKEQRRVVNEIEGQLVAVSTQAAKLQAAITRKNEECAVHGENITRLIEEVNKRSARERDLTDENESLSEQLEVAVKRENELTDQMNAMQNLYAELKSMFNDAEEELRAYRKKPSPYRTPSVDSLYDSLASELETSDSGGWTPRGRRLDAPPPRSLQFSSHSPAIEPSKEEENTPTNQLSLQEELASLAAPPTDLPAITDELPPEDPAESPLALEEPKVEPEEAVVVVAPVEAAVPEPEIVVREPTVPKELEPVPSPLPLVNESLLFSYEPEFSLAAPSREQKKMPEYLEEPKGEERPPSRSSSSASLSDYEAPTLGEPGVPGTRDLKASLNRRVRRQLERDFAAWRARKGLRPSAFFPEGSSPEAVAPSILSPYLVGDARSVLPWRACSAVGLQGVGSIGGGEGGVLTRAEMPSMGASPSASPSHSAFSGLTSVISSFIPSGGIVLRRPFL